MMEAYIASVTEFFNTLKEKLVLFLNTYLSALLMYRIPHWSQPPGPLANLLPYFGSLSLFLQEPSHQVLTKISTLFDRIYRLKFGKTTFIVICDPVLLQDTFSKEAVAGRRMLPMMDVVNSQGIIYNEGDSWKSQRFFVHRVMVDLGVNRTSELKVFDRKAAEAIAALLEEMFDTNSAHFYIDEAICFTLTNIYFSMLVGKTFDRKDELLKSIIKSTHECYRAMQPISFANYLPFFAELTTNKKILENMRVRKERFASYMKSIIQDHRQNLDPGNPRDLIDAYLVQMSNFRTFFSEPQLLAILGDLFTSNVETNSAIIHWILLALIKHPDVQEKIFEELLDVTKLERPPNLDDRNALPTLEATILEGYRISSILPFGLPHRTTEDTTIYGYHVPKGAAVVGLFWKFNRDPKIWVNPTNFDPNNHIDSDGVLVKNHSLMPFSVGKRACLNECVANDQIFLIVANLLYRFQIMPSDNANDIPSLDDSVEGIFRVPRPFTVKMWPRRPRSQPNSQQGSPTNAPH